MGCAWSPVRQRRVWVKPRVERFQIVEVINGQLHTIRGLFARVTKKGTWLEFLTVFVTLAGQDWRQGQLYRLPRHQKFGS